jgi:hypothetical protein
VTMGLAIHESGNLARSSQSYLDEGRLRLATPAGLRSAMVANCRKEVTPTAGAANCPQSPSRTSS